MGKRQYIGNNTFIMDEGGVKYFCFDRKDGSISKTKVQRSSEYTKDEVKVMFDKLWNDDVKEAEAYILLGETFNSVRNITDVDFDGMPKMDSEYRDALDEDGAYRHNQRLNKLAEAYSIVEENRRAANGYAKELNYQDHLAKFLKGVNNGENNTELRKEFDRFYDGTFTDEDIDFMIKLFNNREQK